MIDLTLTGFVLLLIALVIGWPIAFSAMERKSSRWSELMKAFPDSSTFGGGKTYKGRDSIVRDTSYDQSFNIQLTENGLRVRPHFARRQPIFVPWSSMRMVGIATNWVLLTAEYPNPLEFYLPADALPMLRQHIPAEKFQEAVSFMEAVKTSIRTRKPFSWFGSKEC